MGDVSQDAVLPHVGTEGDLAARHHHGWNCHAPVLRCVPAQRSCKARLGLRGALQVQAGGLRGQLVGDAPSELRDSVHRLSRYRKN